MSLLLLLQNSVPGPGPPPAPPAEGFETTITWADLLREAKAEVSGPDVHVPDVTRVRR